MVGPHAESAETWGRKSPGENTAIRNLVEHQRASQVVLVVKNPPANAGGKGDTSSIPGLGRSPRGGNGNPFRYPCLENSMARGAWRATRAGIGHNLATESPPPEKEGPLS